MASRLRSALSITGNLANIGMLVLVVVLSWSALQPVLDGAMAWLSTVTSSQMFLSIVSLGLRIGFLVMVTTLSWDLGRRIRAQFDRLHGAQIEFGKAFGEAVEDLHMEDSIQSVLLMMLTADADRDTTLKAMARYREETAAKLDGSRRASFVERMKGYEDLVRKFRSRSTPSGS